MIRRGMLRAALTAAACAIATAASNAAGGEPFVLAPYQMVRSLQLVQDRIAAGDHAAIPMQRKLLDMIDARFKDTESEDYNDLRNFRAMLIYAMSGGNPRTVETALARIHLDETNRTLGIGILDYLQGDYLNARQVMDRIEPLKVEPELGAFFALVKGSILAVEEPRRALDLFEQARLLSPGTLVEEAALRRTVALSATAGDLDRFFRASEQYVRRFLASPYASQFADSFVTGVIALKQKIDRKVLVDVVADMQPEQQKTIYLRLARRSAIDGDSDLAAFASEQAEAIEVEGFGPHGDPRAELYASIATVTSESVDGTLQRLKKIDRSLLSPNDRKLLDAATSMAAEVVDVPAPEKPEVTPVNPTAEAAVANGPAGDEADPEELIPEGETPPPAAPMQAELKPAADESLPGVAEARRKLDEIDKLLGETAR